MGIVLSGVGKKKLIRSAGVAGAVFLSIFFIKSISNANGDPGNPPGNDGFRLLLDTSIASSIHTEYDMIQFYDRASLTHFYESWKNTKNKRMSIVHLGDSHLQSDILPARIRKNFQKIHGDAGRGMVFPYSTAKTYSSIEYKTTHTGEWSYAKSYMIPPKLPLGVIGMTSNTAEVNASFTLTFDSVVPPSYDKLRIYCKKSHNSYDMQLSFESQILLIPVDSVPDDSLPYIEVKVPPMGKSITIRTVKNSPNENSFEFYGMSMETSSNTGVIFHNCGVGASKYESVLYEELFDAQLPTLNPDLVIIDFGTNNYIYEDSIHTDMDSLIVAVIDKVRKTAPNASIILTSTQDMIRKGHDMRCGVLFSDLVRDIARRKQCGFFDWYWISGGYASNLKWQDKGYAQPDGIHLTMKGYRLKGDLFTNAVLRTIDWMDMNQGGQQLTFNIDSIKIEQQKLVVADTLWNNFSTAGKTVVKHKVAKGQTLGGIAHKYGVSVSQIKKWNNLHSDIIHVGQVLVIYKPKKH